VRESARGWLLISPPIAHGGSKTFRFPLAVWWA
jgi:hypothetical protein